MEGDKLARGAKSATFAVAPKLRFSEEEMRHDVKVMSQEEFCDKYMVTSTEYKYIKFGGEERVNTFVQEMKSRTDFIERELEADKKQEDSLQRDCFIDPYVCGSLYGRVIVSRDMPPKKKSSIALPKSMRKERTLLPTTGHIIKAAVFDANGFDISDTLIGKRILFGPMSGSAICFKGYPTWIQLEISEIMGIVKREDAEVLEEEVEPMI